MPGERWTAPYESGDHAAFRMVLAAGMSAVAVAAFCVVAVQAARPAGVIGVGAFFALFITMVWRVSSVGLFVGESGVKVRNVLRTRVVRWPDVDRVWVGQARLFDAFTIWITVRGSGDQIETPIWRQGTRALHKNRIKLEPAEFAALVDLLRSRAAAASS